MTQPKISIVTPCYNSVNFIERLHKSLLSQNFKDFEWVLVDDCSTDSTIELLKKLEAPGNFQNQIYSLPFNTGGGVALGIAFEKAKSKYVIPIDHDDELTNNSLDIIYLSLLKYSDRSNIAGLFFRRLNPDTDMIIGGEIQEGTEFSMSWQSNFKPEITDGTIVYNKNIALQYFNSSYLESICLAGVPLQEMTKKYKLIAGPNVPVLKYHRDNPNSQSNLPRLSRKIVYTYARYIDLYDILYLLRPIYWLRHICAMIKFSLIVHKSPVFHNKYISSKFIKLIALLMIPFGFISYYFNNKYRIAEYKVFDRDIAIKLANLKN